jgi:hypothetical protein
MSKTKKIVLPPKPVLKARPVAPAANVDVKDPTDIRKIKAVPRQNYDLPLNQSDRSVAGFACLSVSNWLHAAPAEASVRIACPVLLLTS